MPPDRYADAVRARRVELRAQVGLLAGTHRSELRSELALSRIAATDAAVTALAQLGTQAREYAVDGLPGSLGPALDAIAGAVHARWAAELGPALRRIASVRGLDLPGGWPSLPGPRLPVAVPVPVPVRSRSLLAGAVDGLALWRLALVPLAVLPLLGLPVLGGPVLAPIAVGAGAAGVVVAVRSRRAAVSRAALRACVDETVAAARACLDSDLGRRLLELERSVGAELDAAVARRRVVVEAELRALAPDPDPLEVSRG